MLQKEFGLVLKRAVCSFTKGELECQGEEGGVKSWEKQNNIRTSPGSKAYLEKR